jgi:Tol biopolymer transport system component
VSVIDLDGSHRTVLAAGASGPAWSPDGRFIAYHAACGGIRLMTPAALDRTPASTALRCRSFGPRDGVPVRSPDGKRLVVANARGVFEVNPHGGAAARLLTRFGRCETGLGIFRTARPSSRPLTWPTSPRTG